VRPWAKVSWFQPETMVRCFMVSGPMVSAFHGLGPETVVAGASAPSVSISSSCMHASQGPVTAATMSTEPQLDYNLAELEAAKHQSEENLQEAIRMLKIVRDPSIEWVEKKTTMDKVIASRAAAGNSLEALEKQGQSLAALILTKQQELVRVGREAMELSLCRAENDEMIVKTRKTIQQHNASMQQVHFEGSL